MFHQAKNQLKVSLFRSNSKAQFQVFSLFLLGLLVTSSSIASVSFASSTPHPTAKASKSFGLPLPLVSPSAQQDGRFGFSISVSGDLIAIGAPYENQTGNAYVFNATSGALISTLSGSNLNASWFGYSVSLSQNYVTVGAPGSSVDGTYQAGQAYVFSALSGELIAKLSSSNPQYEGWFGWSVAASGSYVTVGAPGEVVGKYAEAGNVYMFGETTGKPIRTLSSPNPQEYGNFGYSVSASGASLAIDAPGELDGVGKRMSSAILLEN